jgi:hypothetical protein
VFISQVKAFLSYLAKKKVIPFWKGASGKVETPEAEQHSSLSTRKIDCHAVTGQGSTTRQ